MKPLLAFAITLCIALPLQAETYKWVDDKGVTNYSSEPPPSAKKKSSSVTVIEDRISVVEKDASLDKAAEGLRQREAKRTELLDADYARRQALPPTKPVTYDVYDECPYGGDCHGQGYYPGYGYYGPYRPGRLRPGHHPSHPIANNNQIPSRPARTIPTPLRGSPRAATPLR